MPDNVGYTPGSGATVAADDVGGVLYQRVKLALGADGVASDVSATNPLPVEGEGELIEVLQAIRYGINVLVNSLGHTYPDSSGQMRVAIGGTVNVTGSLSGVSTVTTVSTVSSVTDTSLFGGVTAALVPAALFKENALALRRNIVVS